MPLVSPNVLYKMVEHKNIAIGAFNVHNMEYTQAVVSAAEAENMPVILMLGEPILQFATLEMLSTIALTAARNSRIPIAIILDHGKKMENILRCIDLGISVMVDGSHLPYEENIRFTKNVVQIAHAAGVSVEGELGAIGGTEDTEEEVAGNMTDPMYAKDFVERTGVDALAVAVGNIHGKYIKPPVIDFERLQKIKSLINVPLVMHGGSDLPNEISKKAINIGIKKFNIGTDLKYAMSESLLSTLSKKPMPFQPQHTFGVAREAVMNKAIEKIRLFKNEQELEIQK